MDSRAAALAKALALALALALAGSGGFNGHHARQLSVLDTSDGMSMADACLAYVREVSASCAVQLKLQRETTILHFELNDVDACLPGR
jgi:hypothetical protein